MSVLNSSILGVKPVILPLQWPPNVQPSALPNFESEARRRRYNAMGEACLAHGIQSLLLAHHEDDQAETILMRLANGHTSVGLRGMKPSSDIPECWGLHGIGLSGDQDHLDMMDAKGDRRLLCVEDGGITVHRPLLLFPKTRLRKTCRTAGAQWVEDETNHDPTVTPRNAIRHILSSRGLPLVLQKPALLALGKTAQYMMKQREDRANSILRQFDVTLDVRSGTLVIGNGTHPHPNTTDIPQRFRKRRWVESIYVASMVLKRLVQIVSPYETVTLGSLQLATTSLFPYLSDQTTFSITASKATSGTRLVNNFTTNGVFFRRLEPSGSQSVFDDTLKPHVQTWEISRQPYYTKLALPQISIPYGSKSPTFQLWDGRYWIRVHNYSSLELVVRPLQEADMKRLYRSLGPKAEERLCYILKTVAPGIVRWSLPVIATRGDENGLPSKVVALPTLEFILDRWKSTVGWEVRYKKVDWVWKENMKILPSPYHRLVSPPT